MRNIPILAVLLVMAGSCSTGGSPAAGTEVKSIDATHDGVYKEGLWEYRYSISAQGTRSEGWFGDLLYSGAAVPEPGAINDYYKTPWGQMFWVGRPVVAFGGHGWMLKPKPSAPEGKELPLPSGAAPRIAIKVLVDGPAAGEPKETDRQIVDELAKLGVKEPVVQQDWADLSAKDHAFHDTKRFGWHKVRLAGVKDGVAQIVMSGGVVRYEKTIELPVRRGETLCLKHTIGGPMDEMDLYLVFRAME